MYMQRPFNFLYMKFLRDHNVKISLNNQKGGYSKIEKFIDKGKTYHFNVETIDSEDFVQIILLSKNNKECVTVLIDKATNETILNNMSYYKDCRLSTCSFNNSLSAVEGLKRPGGGSVLLMFIYNYLLAIKNKYNIKQILLKDNSFLYCKNCPTTTKLARLKMLTHGYTWYSKYGFKPYNTETNSPDKKLLKAYNLNKKLIMKLKTTSVDILKIVKNNKIKYDTDELKRLIDKYDLLGLFVRRLTHDFEKYCCLINDILEEVYNPMPPQKPLLYDMFKKDFYLSI